jgi:O-antigen/teichoic acid export membrane protein
MPVAPLARLQLNRRLIVSNILTLFSGSLLSQGMTSLALLLTARQLGATGYGQYAACFVLTGFSSVVFSLGMDIWLLREGSRDLPRLGELLGSVLTVKWVVGTAWFGLVLLLSPLLDSNSFPVVLVRLSALSVWLDSLFATILTAYKASLRNEITSILESSSDAIWLLATLLLVKSGEQQAAVYIQARVGALFISLIVATVLVWRRLSLRATIETARRVVSEAFPFAASEFLAWTSMRVDVLIVAFALGEHAVGLYSPAVGIVNALFLVPATVYMVVAPVLSRLFVTDVKQAWLTAKRGILLLAVVGTGLSLALLIGARPLISLLGASFSGSQGILQTLSAVLFLHSLSFGMAAVLVATNQQTRRMIVQAITVATNAALNLLVVHRAGIRGVATVYIITEVVLLIGYTKLVLDCRSRSASPIPSSAIHREISGEE